MYIKRIFCRSYWERIAKEEQQAQYHLQQIFISEKLENERRKCNDVISSTKKHTGLYQHGCTSDGLRGFPRIHSKAERQVQDKNGTVHPAHHGARSLGTIPATRSQPRPGCESALPLNLWADGLQLRASVPQMCTKHQPWQAPKPPDRVHEVKRIMQSP